MHLNFQKVCNFLLQFRKTVFSKIRSMKDTGYNPSKSTILCLCLALELNNKETEEMLNIAGYSLSVVIIADKIVS